MLVALAWGIERRADTCVVRSSGVECARRYTFFDLVSSGCTMAQAKILIVDDEVVVAEDIRRQLRALGYLVVGVVASGDEAVRLAGEHQPDLILMDIKLKGPMDGIDAARTIQSRYGTPVIYLTAFSDEETLERARETLPLAYLIKPFVSSDLRAALELALFRQRVSRISEQRGRWLEAVVLSMEDAVVTVDQQGRVTMLNPAAEGLTGWAQPDALGKAVQEVMVLLDPESGRPVPNPAIQVLRKGTSADLGGRPFLLVSRNGHEHRITDSAAMIRDERGNPSGVVLVFRPVAA
jgi:PAS domain S-box-containing protein